ncbi:MAG: hypothetical protein WEB58_04590 [Planctomycetaceae bacterium]
MIALLVYPTHDNCREAEAQFKQASMDAACYPRRMFHPTETEYQNCWNREADVAEQMGFAVFKTVCAVCREQSRCKVSGYLGELMAVKKANIVLCTHKRAEFTGLKDLMKDRKYVSIHEHPVDLLRPPLLVTEADLSSVLHVLNRLLNDPQLLDWFANDLKVDDEGNQYHDEELAVRKQRQFDYAHLLIELAEALMRDLQQTEATVAWQPSRTANLPEGIERHCSSPPRLLGRRLKDNRGVSC